MKVGFVGLGAMGLPMAQRLARLPDVELACFDARADRLRQAPEQSRQGTSVADVAAGASAVLTVLPADPHLNDVVAQVADLAESPELFADFSSVHPDTIERCARQLAPDGVVTVGASLARGTGAARDGTLMICAGTEGALPSALNHLLVAMASDVVDAGSPRAAKAVKLANNMVLGCVVTATAEMMVLGHRLGIGAEQLAVEFAANGAGSWALRHHIQQVLTGDLPVGRFGVRYMAKDMRLFIDWAHGLGSATALAGAAAACYRGASALGYADHYHPIVVRWLEVAAGLPSGAATESAPDRGNGKEELTALTVGIEALQTLTSIEALTPLVAEGVPVSEAEAWLAMASANNDGLPRAAAWLNGEWADLEELRDRLDVVAELAEQAAVPGLILETGRHAAARYGTG